jgi:dihydrodipicolinate synthase/N-acetylneuraminate lyase
LLGTGAFAGIKDSSGDWEYFSGLLRLRQERPFTLLVGHDAVFRRGRSAGASGGVSGVACAVPELMLGLDRAIEMGLAEKVEKLSRHLDDFLGWLSRFPVPVGVKEATAARGLNVGPLAVPLAPASLQKLAEFREWFLGWLPVVQADAKEH